MSTVTQRGYLLIADISGYTSFVAKTELEHSHEIISELLELLVEKFQPVMTIIETRRRRGLCLFFDGRVYMRRYAG
ncbi:MAG: hypothetical protein U0X87_14050 [Anaerolineales bacterium]